ncbi:hypothetical protein SERLA73DRAFT_178788 [Serpula lacrymans var. lacrymans S7.3]|uniref:Cx9C motif-containing protein 4, mitochondrial n=2 Tax=Serpula lacrymans var. lacrymans TaxID=341189 RepID=F8PSX7_SERL3|nr:uncharacterized protein SERLADRAFT_463540 [Serpula lacrymans var. lacrymans S7.9]EGO00835.1 hypothetical protein SERLA73DRAFT_178788 [Serpula lacrymans var. lacrymans S7.3]EGO26457.1 hypothetical protein SERLADRAFT_463540 [Serpula lacrymans var. lacrymans S7.9]
MSKNSQPECQAEACALQTCLSSNTYSPENCGRQLRGLYLCCKQMYSESEGKKESSACPMSSVVERWFKRHPADGQDANKKK